MSPSEEGVWDTTVASRVQPGSEALSYVEARAATGAPAIVAAVALAEMAYGFRAQAAANPTYVDLLDWLTEFAASDLVEIAEFDSMAAIAYGQARALQPTPLSPRRGSGHKSRPRHRAAWLADIQIAATAWTRDLPVITENRRDFERIGELLSQLYPGHGPLEVVAPPDFSTPAPGPA